jgi:hypothetical protein
MRGFDYLDGKNICTSLSGTRINELFAYQAVWKYDHISQTVKQSPISEVSQLPVSLLPRSHQASIKLTSFGTSATISSANLLGQKLPLGVQTRGSSSIGLGLEWCLL